MARGRPSKKGLIASAAQRLFNKAGYQGTSIDQVVVEAQVSKPTVYSNYSSKLLLWQEVLQSVIDANQKELEEQLDMLVSTKTPFAQGWVSIWGNWVDSQDRLAVYRIHWGESHKLTDDELALFKTFETHLESALVNWMAFHNVPEEKFFTLNAVAKESCLIRRLSKYDRSDSCQLLKTVELLA
ncbi:TetR/AcrR family transcriptional regulator [Marinomonas balearica]|uniref:TetR family transcriptional regulator n=1 Tax=Marinomonas balearica TaxID=491947 RepID=A0A4R6MBH1_9GAMM|nr:TetR/AcrR family transcriptional regulator [Marinomonas balearica]TDO98843.1 TetR family transcriptional regulator [Marinomonas balearica]